MTKKARRKLQMRMRRVFRQAVQARKRHQKAVAAYRKLQKKYRAA
ncbi:MAG TPA: hypothetical protein VNL37_07105 [Candidatus Polarisedimenticolia bacterium]|nr:hypothetical protein [Candidatus Polarisedimenticolia bacterium]